MDMHRWRKDILEAVADKNEKIFSAIHCKYIVYIGRFVEVLNIDDHLKYQCKRVKSFKSMPQQHAFVSKIVFICTFNTIIKLK